MVTRGGVRMGVAVLAISLSGCWLQPGFDAGRSAWNPGESTLTAATVADAVELWSHDTGPGAVQNPPLSVNGRVVAVARPSANGQPHLAVGLDAATGTPQWTTPLTPASGGQVVGSPVYDAGTVMIPAAQPVTNPPTGSYRVNLATGALTAGGQSYDLTYNVADGGVASMWKAQTLGFSLMGIDWTYNPVTRIDFGTAAPRDFAFVGDRIMWSAGQYAAGFSAACPPVPELPPGNCLADWWFHLDGNTVSVARLGADGAVWADDTGTVTALDAATGVLRWRAELGPALTKTVAVTDESVFVSTGDNRLVALAPADGAVQWEAQLAAAGGPPVVAGDVVYLGIGTDVVAYSLAGEPLATLAVGSAVTGGPIVDDGRVVVGTVDGRVVAFGLPS